MGVCRDCQNITLWYCRRETAGIKTLFITILWKWFADKILFNIECCVPLNFVCIEKKIYLFSFIYMIVNCSVWSVVAATYTRFRQTWLYSVVGFGDVWSAGSHWSVPQWSLLSGVAFARAEQLCFCSTQPADTPQPLSISTALHCNLLVTNFVRLSNLA